MSSGGGAGERRNTAANGDDAEIKKQKKASSYSGVALAPGDCEEEQGRRGASSKKNKPAPAGAKTKHLQQNEEKKSKANSTSLGMFAASHHETEELSGKKEPPDASSSTIRNSGATTRRSYPRSYGVDDNDEEESASAVLPPPVGAFQVGGGGETTATTIANDHNMNDPSQDGIIAGPEIPLAAEVADDRNDNHNNDDKPLAEASAVVTKSWFSERKNQALLGVIFLLIIGIIIAIVVPLQNSDPGSSSNQEARNNPGLPEDGGTSPLDDTPTNATPSPSSVAEMMTTTPPSIIDESSSSSSGVPSASPSANERIPTTSSLRPTTASSSTSSPTPAPPVNENGARSCETDGDCLLGTDTDGSSSASCGYEGWSEESLAAGKVCCLQGAPTLVLALPPGDGFSQDLFCTNLAAGMSCGSNSLCASGVCVDHICQESIQQDLERCDDDADCVNESCGFQVWSEVAVSSGEICCAGSSSTLVMDKPGTFEDGSFCQNLDNGEFCGDDAMCSSGACGLAEWNTDTSQEYICCESGSTVLTTYPNSFSQGFFCSDLAAGSVCGINDMCNSGVCVANICEGALRQDLERCDDDADCLNGSCGYPSWSEVDVAFGKKCCLGGSSTVFFTNPNSFSSDDFCSDLPPGAVCGTNGMCASGDCLNNVCQDLAGQNDLQPCDDNRDCVTGGCAFAAWTDEAVANGSVCCPGGYPRVIFSRTYPGLGSVEWFCSGLSAGEPCGDNEMCSSGACVEDLCL